MQTRLPSDHPAVDVFHAGTEACGQSLLPAQFSDRARHDGSARIPYMNMRPYI